MTVQFQSHGGELKSKPPVGATLAAPPAGADLSVDAAADFGYFFPPSGNASDYLAEGAATISQLDRLGELMIEQGTPDAKEANSTLPPVLTYWGQFLDHELTARTDRDSEITDIRDPTPADPSAVEQNLKNARTPRFDLDSVYGGVPVGTGVGKDAATVISGMRHPTFTNKMRVGTSQSGTDLPDNLDANRDLPRYVQVQASVREAAKRLAEDSMSDADFAKFIEKPPQARADRRPAQRREPDHRAVPSQLSALPQQSGRLPRTTTIRVGSPISGRRNCSPSSTISGLSSTAI